MARLSDLIKRGKLPEHDSKGEMKIRELIALKKGKSSSEVIGKLDLPSEPDEDQLFVKPDIKSLENISLPREGELDALLSDEELAERKRIEKLYTSIYDFIEGVLNNLKEKKRFTIEKGLEFVSDIVNTEKAIGILYGKAVLGRGIPDNLAAHSANVCIYALMLGMGVNYTREQLVELGIAALLHDVGMVFIPAKIVEKSGKLTNVELAQIRKHPYYSFKVLQSLGKKYSWIAEVAYQEQERENGQGYPRKLKGDDIHDYAKVIGIVDVYEALTHRRPHRKSYMPHEAVKLILGTQKDLFSSEVKRLLLMKLSCFPLGSCVKLNSKAICKVVEIHNGSPLRPTVEILFDSSGRRLAKRKIIHLEQEPLLFITDTVFESDLPL